MRSKITSKYQITIPREVRERLKLKVADAIEWKTEGERIYVVPVDKPILKHKGAIHVQPGDIGEDIEQARRAMADRYR